MLPHTDNVVVLGLQLFQEVKGKVAELFLLTVTAYGKKHRDGRIDEQQVERAVAEMLLVLGTERAEGVVGLPVRGDVRREQVLQLVNSGTLQKLAEAGLTLIVEVGQLRQSDVWKVLRAQAEEVPAGSVHRFHPELMGQVLVLIAQTGEVAVVQGILLVVLGNGVEFQETRLSHEDCLNLEEVVAMVSNGGKGNIQCPLFKDVAVDAEAVVAGQRHKVGVFPRTVTLRCPTAYVLGLAFQSFGLQGCHPGVDRQPCQVGNNLIARWILVGMKQFFVMVTDMLRYADLHLRNKLSEAVLHFRIDDLADVEHHVVIA